LKKKKIIILLILILCIERNTRILHYTFVVDSAANAGATAAALIRCPGSSI